MSSIHDVAKEAGVSTATVSRTFSTPDLLSHHTRQRVLDVAQRLNYRPRGSKVVRTDARKTNLVEMPDTLGFLFFALESDASPINDFYAPVLSGAQAEAAHLGMHLIVRAAPRHTPPQEMPPMFRKQSVAGMLLVGAAPPEVLAAYDASLPQSVLVDNRDGVGRHDCILSDGFGGAYEATQHLLGLGHRRIGFVMSEPTAPSFQDRRCGYFCALMDAGLMPDPAWTVAASSFEGLEARTEATLGLPDRPTALVVANDTNAFIVMRVCRRLGVSIPEDLSVIGFDDVPFSVHTVPPLTTLSVDKEYMGRLAVRRLHTRIAENQSGVRPEPPVTLTIPVSLILRETSAPPKN